MGKFTNGGAQSGAPTKPPVTPSGLTKCKPSPLCMSPAPADHWGRLRDKRKMKNPVGPEIKENLCLRNNVGIH